MVSGYSTRVPSPAMSTARTWHHRTLYEEVVTMSIGDPQDKPTDPPGALNDPETAPAIVEGREYERPKIHPQDEETEGDFWCD